MWLFLIFVAVPIIEIALFIQLGGFLGLFPTLAIVVLTALIGTVLVRQQGFATLNNLKSSMAEGGDPVRPLVHGLMILIAGVLLLTPGFFTDAVGLLLLIPAVRDKVMVWGAGRFKMTTFGFDGPSAHHQQPRRPEEEPVDAEFEVVPDESVTEPGTSGWTKGPHT